MNYGDITECKRCHGYNMQVVKYPISGGRVQYRHQCKDCGYVDGASIKFDSIPEGIDPPLCDKEMQSWHYDNYHAIVEDKERNFTKLQAYYLTNEWQIRRKHRLAFNQKYFNGKCERCGINDAEVVHHRNYRVLGGKEHAFDLECICRECHALIHPHLRGDEIE